MPRKHQSAPADPDPSGWLPTVLLARSALLAQPCSRRPAALRPSQHPPQRPLGDAGDRRRLYTRHQAKDRHHVTPKVTGIDIDELYLLRDAFPLIAPVEQVRLLAQVLNRIRGNRPADLLYVGSGRANRFVGNDCGISIPGGLCP